MRDAHHALLQSALSLVTALLSVLNHMQEADITPPMKGGSHDNKAPRRPTSSNGSIPTIGPGALVSMRIDAEREYKVDEVAERLRVSPQTVRKMIDNDKLKAEKRGTGRGHWIVQGAELLRYTHQTGDQQP
jgi:excisionase family DNA binding protein